MAVKNYLKINDEYNYSEILKDKLRLALIGSLDRYDNLIDYFSKNRVDLINNREYDDLVTYGFELYDVVPLYTIFELCVFSKSDHLLYCLYTLNNRLKNNFIVPEGVKSIDFHCLSDDYKRRLVSYFLIKEINTFPKGLKSIRGNMRFENIYYYYYEDINFNDDLEYLTTGIDTCIPSSVKNVNDGLDEYDSIGYIKFRDFKNSKIVNDRMKFIEFLEKYSANRYTGKKEVCMQSKSTLGLQNKYRTGRFTTFDHASLYAKDYVKYTYKNEMLFYEICFIDESSNMEIVIP